MFSDEIRATIVSSFRMQLLLCWFQCVVGKLFAHVSCLSLGMEHLNGTAAADMDTCILYPFMWRAASPHKAEDIKCVDIHNNGSTKDPFWNLLYGLWNGVAPCPRFIHLKTCRICLSRWNNLILVIVFVYKPHILHTREGTPYTMRACKPYLCVEFI